MSSSGSWSWSAGLTAYAGLTAFTHVIVHLALNPQAPPALLAKAYSLLWAASLAVAASAGNQHRSPARRPPDGFIVQSEI